MVEIPEHTQTLIKNCMIQRLTTDESLDYLEKNNVKISERTFRRYKSEILEIQNALEFIHGDTFKKSRYKRWRLNKPS